MEARIRKEELIAFKAQAGDIVVKGDLRPILTYLKIEVEGDFATITKSNDRSFIVKTIPNDSEDCTFLVNEQALYDFMEAADGDHITFASKGATHLRLTAGKAKIDTPTEQPHTYPTIDLSNSEWSSLPKLAIVSAAICAKIVLDSNVIISALSHVFIGDGWAAGANGSTAYYQPISEPMPRLILRRDVAACVGKMASCQVSQNVSYDLFKDGECVFGFVKSEVGWFSSLPSVFVGAGDEPLSFSTNKANILKFTNLCTARAPKGAAATFEAKNNELDLMLVDGDTSQDIHFPVPIKGNSGTFKFDPNLMTQLLKNIPCDDVYFYPGKNKYYITDLEKTFFTAIMLII